MPIFIISDNFLLHLDTYNNRRALHAQNFQSTVVKIRKPVQSHGNENLQP